MRRHDSLSSVSTASDDAPSRPASSAHRRGHSSPGSVAEQLYDPSSSRDDSESSLVTETETDNAGNERARARRKKIGKGKVGEGRDTAASDRRGKPLLEMRSLGVQRVQLQHILPGNTSSNTTSTNRKTPAKAPPSTDLEKQASTNKKRRAGRLCSTMSAPRRAYIIGVIVLCVILVSISIVIGVNGAKEKKEREQKLEALNPGAELYEAQEKLDNEAMDAQSQLKKYKTDVGGATATTQAALPFQTGIFAQFPELHELLTGNREWRNETEVEDPGLIEELAEGQKPKLAYIGCADSRVPETTVLDAKPGELFVVSRLVFELFPLPLLPPPLPSLGLGFPTGFDSFHSVDSKRNQYLIDDLSSETVLSYAIAHLGVQHIVIMGHTECGAVQAAIASPSKDVNKDIGETRIDSWIRPIRQLYAKSNRSEIVDFRKKTEKQETDVAKDITDEVWRALVEENVKLNVERVAADSSVAESWDTWKAQQNGTAEAVTSADTGHRKRASDEKKLVELWVHGWVYDVSTGLVSDLGVSIGPNGAYEDR
ncbi:hypothetical protein JCM11251_001851 [Rhodosporidiobolus azoricus]